MTRKILTIGEILVEFVATTQGDGFGEAQPLTGPYPSGAPAIFIDQVGRMGQACAILGRVGDDDFGHLNIDRLRDDGVDVNGIEIAPGEVTGCAFVRYRPDGSRRFVFTLPQSAAARLPATTASEALIESCDHLHIMGTALTIPDMAALARSAVQRIKARGGSLSFDPNLRAEMLDTPGLREELSHMLTQTDLFLPSGDEIFLFSEATTEQDAVDDLLGRGISDIVVKRGNQGASHYCRKGRTDVAPLSVEELDPTGAGDCFGGAFVALWLEGAAPDIALRYANAAGAHSVTRLGPMEGAATRHQLDRLLASQETRS
ncbi:tagatose kinase [Modicisalibacter radicis]|uniref:tagatose kinase n=1 Tax=Halomonas sp. EAR18 TaxID=2518972 RepID=UPI00109C7C24|nr:sugar kinase [Halomonas sp. EAR18]